MWEIKHWGFAEKFEGNSAWGFFISKWELWMYTNICFRLMMHQQCRNLANSSGLNLRWNVNIKSFNNIFPIHSVFLTFPSRGQKWRLPHIYGYQKSLRQPWKVKFFIQHLRDHSRYLFNGSSKHSCESFCYGQSSDSSKGECKLSIIWCVKQFWLKILILLNLIDKYNRINE